MKLLLDAHAVIWAVDDPSRLGTQAVAALQHPGNDLLLSAGTIWEIAVKAGLGKLSLSLPFGQWMNQAMADLGAELLHITVAHADSQIDLPRHHGDPFDRLLAAQARVESLVLISNDAIFNQYGIQRIW